MGGIKWNSLTRRNQGEEANEADSQSRRSKAVLSYKFSFWFLAILMGFLLFAASAPSPLYGIYEAMWHFSSVTLTAIYATYALAALAAALTTGRLSDHLGRRPVLILALVIQIAAMVPFIFARSVGALFAGRFLQGLGTGIASQAISAWLLDLQPTNNPRIGGLIGGASLLAGLAAGALGSGLLVQYGPNPLHLVFWLLAGIYLLAFIVILIIPDISPRTPGWLRSLTPQIGVPPVARSMFAASVPSLIAIWALVGLYLSLGPALAISLLRTNSHIDGGLIIFVLMGGGAIAAILLQAVDPRLVIGRGSLILIVGVGLTLLAVMMSSPIGLYIGSLVAGIGFGSAYTGIFRSLAMLAPPDKRSTLLSAVYLIIYLAFGIPAVIAGMMVTRLGLRDTTYAYGLFVMAMATITLVAVSRREKVLSAS